MTFSRRRIVVFLIDERHEFQRYQMEDAKLTALRLGYDVDVFFAENSAVRQTQQVYSVLELPPERRPHAIMLETVRGDAFERVAFSAVEAGIAWIILNRTVDYLGRLRLAAPQVPIATFGTDQVDVGRIQGRQARVLVAPGGLILYVQGPAETTAASRRLAGAQQELAGLDVQVVQSDWSEASGEATVSRWLRVNRRRPSVVVCQNDHIAMGASRALRDAYGPLEALRIPVTGVDGLPSSGQGLVRLGQLAATVIVPSNTGPAIEWLHTAHSGRERFTERLLTPSPFLGRGAAATVPAGPRLSLLAS